MLPWTVTVPIVGALLVLPQAARWFAGRWAPRFEPLGLITPAGVRAFASIVVIWSAVRLGTGDHGSWRIPVAVVLGVFGLAFLVLAAMIATAAVLAIRDPAHFTDESV